MQSQSNFGSISLFFKLWVRLALSGIYVGWRHVPWHVKLCWAPCNVFPRWGWAGRSQTWTRPQFTITGRASNTHDVMRRWKLMRRRHLGYCRPDSTVRNWTKTVHQPTTRMESVPWTANLASYSLLHAMLATKAGPSVSLLRIKWQANIYAFTLLP